MSGKAPGEPDAGSGPNAAEEKNLGLPPPPPPAAAGGQGQDADALLKAFLSDVSDARRLAECDRVLNSFKLNPYAVLNLLKQDRANKQEIRRQFRQCSLLVHPDKCKHDHAKQAFELVNKAYKDLGVEETKKEADATVKHARIELRKERRKLTRNDNAYRAAAALRTAQAGATPSSSSTGGGGEKQQEKEEEAGVGCGEALTVGERALEREYEETEVYHRLVMRRTQELMTQLEWRRRQLGKRLGEEKKRQEDEDTEHKQKMRSKVEEAKTWADTREKRVSSWRDFVKTGKKIKKKKRRRE